MNWKVNSLIPLNYNISKSIEKKINRNIYYVIKLFKSSCDGLDWETFLQDIFPEFYLRKNPERCKEIIFELEEITKDDFKRDYLSPIHEYALYHLLQWWIDVTDVEMGAVINGDEIVTEDDEFWSEEINDIEGYKDICFPCTAEARKEFDNAVIGAYEQALTQGQSQVQKQEMPVGTEQCNAHTMTM